jgi:hypothetical protein
MLNNHSKVVLLFLCSTLVISAFGLDTGVINLEKGEDSIVEINAETYNNVSLEPITPANGFSACIFQTGARLHT